MIPEEVRVNRVPVISWQESLGGEIGTAYSCEDKEEWFWTLDENVVVDCLNSSTMVHLSRTSATATLGVSSNEFGILWIKSDEEVAFIRLGEKEVKVKNSPCLFSSIHKVVDDLERGGTVSENSWSLLLGASLSHF